MAIVVPVLAVGDQYTAGYQNSIANWINTEDTFMRGRETGSAVPVVLTGNLFVTGTITYVGTYTVAPIVVPIGTSTAGFGYNITARTTTSFDYRVFVTSGVAGGTNVNAPFTWIAFL